MNSPTSDSFQALVLETAETPAHCRPVPIDHLPPGELTVAVQYSGLNYKDALAITGAGPIVRSYPMVPGIDLAGEVIDSNDPRYVPGDRVIVTGWGMGEAHWGGMATRARVPADWAVPLPSGMDAEAAMRLGTAGLTAMLSVMALEEAGTALDGEILVTGASGGVGSLALALLAEHGHRVTGVTGRDTHCGFIERLGAYRVMPREELLALKKPLAGGTWSGAVDVAGGETLAAVLRGTAYGGTVTACGLADDAALATTVFPFILRGVRLQGIDSVHCPEQRRQVAWQRLARGISPQHLEVIGHQRIPLEAVPEAARALLAGELHGRVVIDVGT